MSARADPAFSTIGFSNWKKAVDSFREHECSLAHKDALKFSFSTKSEPVSVQLQKEFNDIRSKRRSSFLKQLTCLQYLLRQGLALRNDHAGGSNLSVMMEQVLKEELWVKDKKYQSPEIINEIVEIMGHKVLRSLLSDILCQQWFSLMADETRDSSNREQLVICFRWVTETYEVSEDFIGLIQLENTTAETVYSSLKDCLLKLGVPFEYCRGQAYDGARTFQGHVSGVARDFKMLMRRQSLFIV